VNTAATTRMKPSVRAAPSASGRFTRLAAEALGTLLLVGAGTGTGVFAARFPAAGNNTFGVGFLGVALAIGIAVAVGIYVFGPVSGGHLNPVVTLGLAAAKRFPWRDVPGYLLAQVVGGALGSSIVASIAATGDGVLSAARENGFAANGFGEHSPGGFGMAGAIVAEFVFTAIFVHIALATTSRQGATTVAPLMIGLSLTLIGLCTIPVDNTSLNPARSFAVALYAGGWAWSQLWVFIVFPILGGLLAGWGHRVRSAPR
jgi:aquaporin Z